MRTPPITYDEARSFVRYDQETGEFFRERPSAKGWRKGQRLRGTVNSRGYVFINYDKRPIAAHRLAWLLVTGEWPAHSVDHVNRDRTDNRWDNLRLAPHGLNAVNRVYPNRLPRGVLKSHNKTNPYRARITVRGRSIFLGYFSTPEKASDAYLKAAATHFGADRLPR